MLKHDYSSKINNNYAYTNKSSYGSESVSKDQILIEDQVTDLRDWIEKAKEEAEKAIIEAKQTKGGKDTTCEVVKAKAEAERAKTEAKAGKRRSCAM